MTEDNVHNIHSMDTVAPPPKPSPTASLEREAQIAIDYLNKFTQSSRLDPEMRMAMNDIQNTLKNLKQTVHRQSADAQANHEKQVEILKSNRLI